MDKKRLGSFVIGGLAGMVAGILLAPKSGRETRGGLADRAGEARQRSSETYHEARERLRERVSASGRSETAPEHDLVPGSPPDHPPKPPENEPPRRPVLRDVSRGTETPEGPAEPEATDAAQEPVSDRQAELRRKVRETRERIRVQEKKNRAADGGAEDDPR